MEILLLLRISVSVLSVFRCAKLSVFISSWKSPSGNIHPVAISAYLLEGCRGAGADPSWHWVRGKGSSWTSRQSITTFHTHFHTYGQCRLTISPNLHVFGLKEETEAPGNPHRHRETIQTPQGKAVMVCTVASQQDSSGFKPVGPAWAFLTWVWHIIKKEGWEAEISQFYFLIWVKL